MTKNNKSLIFASIVLTLTFVGTYLNFAEYRPKTIKQVQDVKGLQSGNPEIILPVGAEKVSVNRSTDAEQTTFHINKSKQDIQAFYKNIFISSKWELESQGDHNDFIVARYTKGNEKVSVITLDTNDGYKTLVSLETSNQ